MKECCAKKVTVGMCGIQHPCGICGRIVKDRQTKTWKTFIPLGLNKKKDSWKPEKAGL